MERAKCELCGRKAVLRCDADAANLCGECDGKVHGANFLVACHVRRVLCSACDRPAKECVSGPRPLCMASGGLAECAETQSPEVRNGLGKGKMEGMLRRWHAKLNLRSRYTVPLAMRLLAKVLPRIGDGWIKLRMRICLAASLWMAAKLTEKRSVALKNIEECTRVPSKLVVLGEMKMWNTVATADRQGWSGCCHCRWDMI